MPVIALSALLFAIVGTLSPIAVADSIYIGAQSFHFVDYPKKPKPAYLQGYDGAPCAKNETGKPSTNLYYEYYCGTDSKREYDNQRFNEQNNLLAYERGGYGAGFYKNSFGHITYFVQKQFNLVTYRDFKLLANVGIDYGYNDCSRNNRGQRGRWCPDASLELNYTQYNFQPAIILTRGALSLSTKLQF